MLAKTDWSRRLADSEKIVAPAILAHTRHWTQTSVAPLWPKHLRESDRLHVCRDNESTGPSNTGLCNECPLWHHKWLLPRSLKVEVRMSNRWMFICTMYQCLLEPESKRHVWGCTWTIKVTHIVNKKKKKWSDKISRKWLNWWKNLALFFAMLTSLTAQSGILFASDTNWFLSPLRLGPNPLHPSSSSRHLFYPFCPWCRCATEPPFTRDSLTLLQPQQGEAGSASRLHGETKTTLRYGCARIHVIMVKWCGIDQRKLASSNGLTKIKSVLLDFDEGLKYRCVQYEPKLDGPMSQ